jgi:hypothetical protein
LSTASECHGKGGWVYEIRGTKGWAGPPMLLRNAPRDAGYVEAPRRMWQSRFSAKSRQENRSDDVSVRSAAPDRRLDRGQVLWQALRSPFA